MNASNSYAPTAFGKASQFEDFRITINGLQPETNYTLHAIGTSQYPGYPDLMDSEFVTVIDFETEPAVAREVLQEDSGVVLRSAWRSLLVMMLLARFTLI